MFPVLEILAPKIEGDARRYLQHRIGAMLFSGGRTSVKFQFKKGWDEHWCEIREVRPDLYSMEIYKITGKSSGWKFDPHSPGGMRPPSRGSKTTIVDRRGLDKEQVLKEFQRATGLVL